MKKIWMMAAALGLGIWLTGCSPAFVPVEDPSEPHTEERNSPETEKDDQREDLAFQPLSEEERRWIVTELESFDGDHKFSDMDPEKAASCGGEIRDAYDFVGRETENGYGYVLGFRKGKEDPLKDLSIYSIDDVIEAEKWNEDESIFEKVYTFENVYEMYYTEAKDVLFFVPSGMEESEELRKAFTYSLCDGDEGVRYLETVKERGVRMSPPEDGGYLTVRRFEAAEVLEEYIPLTEDQEKEITGSDETVDPVMYGIDGITYTASQEIYESENPDPDEITVPALRIAEEKCEFQTVGTEDMKEITSAELEVIPISKELEKEKGLESKDSADVEADSEVVGISETLQDPELLKRLEEILSGASFDEEKECPYNGILTLTKADGTQITVRLASDGCDSMVYGSYGFYQAAGDEVAEIWYMFPEVKAELVK